MNPTLRLTWLQYVKKVVNSKSGTAMNSFQSVVHYYSMLSDKIFSINLTQSGLVCSVLVIIHDVITQMMIAIISAWCSIFAIMCEYYRFDIIKILFSEASSKTRQYVLCDCYDCTEKFMSKIIAKKLLLRLGRPIRRHGETLFSSFFYSREFSAALRKRFSHMCRFHQIERKREIQFEYRTYFSCEFGCYVREHLQHRRP